MKRLFPRTIPFWLVDAEWNTYPFRLVWIAFWMVSYDRSGRWFERWPHISICRNDD